MRTAQRTLLTAIAVPALVLATAPVTQANAGRHVGERGIMAAPAEATNAFTYKPLVPIGARVKVDSWYLPDGRSVVVLRASGLAANYEFGAHAHAKACGPLGGDAGSHYQFTMEPATVPPTPSTNPAYANPVNEVWLDFTTDSKGRGWAMAVQDWQPHADRRPGSVVLHIEHTHDGSDGGAAGTAGARLACVTVGF
jgi:Cu-Zn family superoxide dismutase